MILYGFFGCPQKSHESPSSPNARKPVLSSTCGPTRGSSNSCSRRCTIRARRRAGVPQAAPAAARPPPGPKSSRAHAKPRDRAGTPPKRRAGARDAVAVQVLATNDAEGQQVARVARVSRSHYFEADGALLALLQRLPPPLPRLFFLHAKQLNENTEAFTQPDNIACLQLSKLNIQPYRCPMTSIPPSVAVLALYAREFLSAPDSTCLGHQRLPDMAQGAPSDFPLNICHTAHKTQRPHMTSTSAFDALDVPLSRTRVGTYSASHGLATQGDPTTHHQSVFAASPDRERPDRPSDAVYAW